MQLIYENELGRISLGGGHADSFNITEINGLSFPETEADTVRFSGVPGQTVVSVAVLPRTITISGDIEDKTGIKTQKGAKVFSKSGTLYVVSNSRKRMIKSRCTSFTPEKRKGIFVPFTLQLVCDNPYFEDISKTKESILKKEKLLKSPFILPVMFSKRITEARIINRGTYENEPVFEITCKENAACPKGIVIKNLTTGKSIELLTDVLKDEIITVDINQRKITSNIRGNLLGTLGENSKLSELYLAVGINDIWANAEEEPELLSISCNFRNSYVEALI